MGKVVVRAWEVSPKEIGAKELIEKEEIIVIYKKYPSSEEEEKEGPWFEFEEKYLDKIVEIIKDCLSKFGFPVESVNVIGTDDFGEWVDYEVTTKDDRKFIISIKVLEITEYYSYDIGARVIEVTYRALKEVEEEIEAIAKTFNDFRNMVNLVACTYGIDNMVELLWKEIDLMGFPDKVEFIESVIRKIVHSDIAERKELKTIKCGNSIHVAVKNYGTGERVIRAHVAGTKINIIVPAEE